MSYTVAWLFFAALFVVIEGSAIASREPGAHFSGHIWRWFSVKGKSRGWLARRTVLVAFLGWLLLHLGFGIL